MTTGDCCHLPGSLCDCSGSPAFSKVVEATGLGPPQYVAQVTSRDGRLLSTVIRALDTSRNVWKTMTHVLDNLCAHQGHTPGPELPQEGPSIPRDQAGAETSLKWRLLSPGHGSRGTTLPGYTGFSAMVPSAGSAMREPTGRACCLPVVVLARWAPCTRAAWRSGSPRPTPATASCATRSLQWRSGPGPSQSG
uniref:Membrane associated ring-CH-type finger 2 n=1 Tax=Lynx canadensis TaxID=61383 RepID=A0A667I7N0_LYNCA